MTMPPEQVGVLSNFWFSTVANDYSIAIFLGATLIITVLKILAVIHPGNRTDSIVCLVSGWLYGFPGMKKTSESTETTTATSTETTTVKEPVKPV